MPDGNELGIAVRDVWRRFGAVPALSGMTLSAPYGQVTALVGPNGAGKTTLLLILASLLRPDRGDVRVAGADRRGAAARSRLRHIPGAVGVAVPHCHVDAAVVSGGGRAEHRYGDRLRTRAAHAR